MSFDALATLTILALTFAALMKTTMPAAAVFAAALTAAVTLKLAPVPQLLKGFSNQGMLTVGVLFIVAAGMYSTGAIGRLIDRLMGTPKRLGEVQIKLLPAIAAGSGFLNNTPLVAMLIPVIRDLARSTGLTAPRIYLPLSFASILGGSCTVIGTSTNLIIAGLVAESLSKTVPPAGLREIQMFDSAWPGVPVAVTGIALLMVLSRFLLPDRTPPEETKAETRCYSAEFKVREKSRLQGKSLSKTGILKDEDLELLSLHRQGQALTIEPELTLEPDDHLVLTSGRKTLTDLWRYNNLVPSHRGDMKKERLDHNLVSAVVSRTSNIEGLRVKELPAPGSPYRFRVVALSRDGGCLDSPLADIQVRAGDHVILEVDEAFLYQSQVEKDFSLTKPLKECYLQRTQKSLMAGCIAAAMVLAVSFQLISMLNAAMLASAAMLATGCLSLRIAVRSIDWQTLLVIACAIGLGSAVTESGLADHIAGLILKMGATSPHMALAAVFAGTSIMTNLVTNNAAAAFMFPIVLSTAQRLDVSAMPFVVALMISASCAFISPAGYQTNLMVWEPGHYQFIDFVKVGVPLTLLAGILTVGIVPMVFSF